MEEKIFEYNGYKIPENLVYLTGGGSATWDAISQWHMDQYKKYCPIESHHYVLEIGCGVGRDALPLTKIISKNGSYLGADIIKPSIEWCQNNITPQFPNFKFLHFDVNSQIHNPKGKVKTTDITLPIKNNSIDRIILQSVFTHMFEEDIVHYLKEFNRVLKDNGKICASYFIIDDESTTMAKNTSPTLESVELKFKFFIGNGCYINDENYPEGAVGYTENALNRMLRKSKLELDQPIHRGSWCGRKNVSDGQDMIILKKKKDIIDRLWHFLNKKTSMRVTSA